MSPAKSHYKMPPPAAYGKAAASQIPHADLIEYPDLGHAPQIQDPARFNGDLIAWLKSH